MGVERVSPAPRVPLRGSPSLLPFPRPSDPKGPGRAARVTAQAALTPMSGGCASGERFEPLYRRFCCFRKSQSDMYMICLGPNDDRRAAAVQAALDMAALRCAAVLLRGSRQLREGTRPLSTAWELGCHQVSMEMSELQPAFGALNGVEALSAAHEIRAKWVTKEEATRHGWPATVARDLTRPAPHS